MKLEELQRLAEGATPGPWQRSGVRQKLGDEDCLRVGPDGFTLAFLPIGRRPKEQAGAIADAAYIAAMSPDTAKKLIAAARAAQDLIDYERKGMPATPESRGWPFWDEKFDALRTALEELK